jgi:hypothetical protein
VQLTVVAGVLEPRASSLRRVDGVLLPDEETWRALNDEKMRDTQALLQLMDALQGDVPSNDRAEDSTSSSCQYMNASSCSEESVTPKRKQLVTELD